MVGRRTQRSEISTRINTCRFRTADFKTADRHIFAVNVFGRSRTVFRTGADVFRQHASRRRVGLDFLAYRIGLLGFRKLRLLRFRQSLVVHQLAARKHPVRSIGFLVGFLAEEQFHRVFARNALTRRAVFVRLPACFTLRNPETPFPRTVAGRPLGRMSVIRLTAAFAFRRKRRT